VSRPPTAGPSAAPAAPAVAHARVARRSEPYTAGISSSAAQTAAAPPTACRQRAAISTPIDGAAASEACRREQPEPRRCQPPRPDPRRGVRRRYRGRGEDEVEPDQHPGDRRDRNVELPVDGGQREDDHRGVGEHQAHRRAERDSRCPRITRRHLGRV